MPATIPQNARSGFNKAHQLAPYRSFHAGSSYQTQTGLYAMPLAKKPEPGKVSQRVVRLHAPVTYRVYSEVVVRLGAWPEIPPARLLPGEVLAFWRITPQVPELQTNERDRIYTVEVEYFFLPAIPTEEKAPLAVGASPYEDLPANYFELPKTVYAERLAPQ